MRSRAATDVLVVGAGPAGLATAMSALRHGAEVLVIDRRSGTSAIPRAIGVGTRSMEIFRQWGLSGPVRAGVIDCEPHIAVAHTLVERPLQRLVFGQPTVREALAVSPAHPLLCPQDHIETVLVAEVRRLGGTVRFDTALTGMSTGGDPGHGVCARLGGGRVQARFVVGADGHGSIVRAALGIGVERLGTLGEYLLAVFRADLPRLLRHRLPGLTVLLHPDASGFLFPVGSGRWAYARRWHPERGERLDEFTAERWTALLRAATGLPGLDPQLLGVRPFGMTAEVAASYRRGPGFLVGDAAHRMAPVGGIGLNAAIQDGHELGWRLAWVLRGLAEDPLLDGYAAEREPVGRLGAICSLRDPTECDPTECDPTECDPTECDPTECDPTECGPAARPGQRAPHVWVRHHDRWCSVLDLFEDRLMLLAGRSGDHWVRAAAGLGELPLEVHLAGRGLSDEGGRLSRAYRLGVGSAVLVRPDGIVAWRHDGPCRDPAGALAAAAASALGRSDAQVYDRTITG